MSEPDMHEFNDLLLGQLSSRFRHDDGNRQFSPKIVRYTDDGTLQNGGMAINDVFNLRRGDVFPTRDDNVLTAIDDPQRSFTIDRRQISGMKPVVANGISSRLRVFRNIRSSRRCCGQSPPQSLYRLGPHPDLRD